MYSLRYKSQEYFFTQCLVAMKTQSLLVSRLLLLVLVPILAEAISVSRSGNNVTLSGCQASVYHKGTRLTENGQNYNLMVNHTTEGVYGCGTDSDNDVIGSVTVLRKSLTGLLQFLISSSF